jgi:DeoR/GlpR family transcriptional regulator of sugar metabolism
MQAEERHIRIEAHLQKVEFASLDELAEQVEASQSTVRRDLIALEESGVLRRTHGGARIVAPRSDEFAFTARDTHQLTEKELIGRACAGLIHPHQSVIIDAGTTTYHAARHLENLNIQVITNSLPVANLFASNNNIEVVVSGGVIYPRLGVLVGPLAVQTFSAMHVDVAIMSAGGITPEGITNSHGLLIDIQHAMIAAAKKVILCLDHTKFGRQSLSPLCGLDKVHTIVTDSLASPELVHILRSRGIQVIQAQAAPEDGVEK